jgi:histidinol dehydrogenase
VRRLSVIQYSTRGLAEAWPHLAELARVEGLQAHSEAARVRIASNGGGTA